VNGSYGRAGTGADHSPVRGHVENVQPMPSGESRKHELVPEDVIYGRPKTFWNRNDRRTVLGKREKRQIVMKDKKHELDVGTGIENGAAERKNVAGDPGLAALNNRSGQANFHFLRAGAFASRYR